MQEINVNELKPHPRNTEFFDDMSGEKWSEFKDSVKSRLDKKNNGEINIEPIIEPLIVTTNMTVVSGHQRLRACKELGINRVKCEIRKYDSDDDILKDLIETNIRQRGDVGGSAKKVGFRIKELERLYGIKNGGDRKSEANNSLLVTQSDLAKNLGIDVSTLKNYKKLTEMIPELEDLVDTGITTPTTALAIMRSLSESEQIELISSMDTTKKITQQEVQKYVNEKRELENRVKELESQFPEKEVIDNTDYEAVDNAKKKAKEYESDYKSLRLQFDSKVSELQELRKQIDNMKKTSPTEQYSEKMKNSVLLFCSKVATFIEQVGGYVWLTDEINKIPELEKEGYIKSVHAIKSWADTMEYNINNKTKEII